MPDPSLGWSWACKNPECGLIGDGAAGWCRGCGYRTRLVVADRVRSA